MAATGGLVHWLCRRCNHYPAGLLQKLYIGFGFPDAMPRREDMDLAQALSAPQALMITIATGIYQPTAMDDDHRRRPHRRIADRSGSRLKQSAKDARLPVLAVGLGIYLPPTIGSTLFVGALLAWVIHKILSQQAQAAGAALSAYAQVHNRRGV